MIYGIGASIDISVRSVLRESRPGFPARGHDSESKRGTAPDKSFCHRVSLFENPTGYKKPTAR